MTGRGCFLTEDQRRAGDPAGKAVCRTRLRGSVTVFAALCLPILLSVFVTTIEGARRNAMRLQVELAMDIAVNSVLSEFHKELHKQYDLLFIDPSYGTAFPSAERTREHLLEYLDKNLTQESSLLFWNARDLQALSTESVSLTGVRCMADERYRALWQQVYAYMSVDPAGRIAAEVFDHLDTLRDLEEQVRFWERLKEENDREFRELQNELVYGAEEEETKPEVENPAEAVESFRLQPALLQILGTTDGVSEAKLNTRDIPSRRALFKGTPVEADVSHEYPEADILWFDEYILEKCGFYRNTLKKSGLKYQAEYILFGEDSDRANLERIGRRLLLLRNAVNCAYLFSDGMKTTEAGILAAGISAVVFLPALQPVLKNMILFGWAYLESVLDVRALFDGKRVPILKTGKTWKTSLSGIFSPSLWRDSGKYDEKGAGKLSYKDHLRFFLYLENKADKSERLMDMMETDIRATAGNGAFQIDACFDTLAAEVRAASRFGDKFSCSIARGYN